MKYWHVYKCISLYTTVIMKSKIEPIYIYHLLVFYGIFMVIFVNIITLSLQRDDYEVYPVDTSWAVWIPNISFSPFWHHELVVIAKCYDSYYVSYSLYIEVSNVILYHDVSYLKQYIIYWKMRVTPTKPISISTMYPCFFLRWNISSI